MKTIMESEVETITKSRDIWQISAIILGVCLFVSVMINFAQDDYTKKQIEFALDDCHIARKAEVAMAVEESRMRAFALMNVYMYSAKTLPPTLLKMVTAAKDGNRADFDFYLRLWNEEAKKFAEKKVAETKK